MGLAADCRVDHGARSSKGRAQLEADALLFQGDFRLKIPLRDVRRLSAEDGRLEVRFGAETAVFHLGAAAARWADKIQNPPSVLDKLGLKAGMKVAVAGTIADPALVESIQARVADVAVGRPRAGSDVIVFFAAKTDDLSRLESLRRSLIPAGAVWVVWPKGRRDLKEDHVRAAAREVGLVDVKVASVSPVLSGLKLMIPRAKR